MLIKTVQPVRRMAGRIVRGLMGNLVSVETREPIAALTFDDGPDPEFTLQLLNTLKRYHAHATFFMVGENARQHPEIVQQVVADGHAVGNHSWDHPSFPLISAPERRRQIRRCASVIDPHGGLRLFRPPYGHQSFCSRLDALWFGYTVVMWDVVVGDWLDHDASWIADRLLENIRPGSIVCLHDRVYGNVSDAPLFDRGPMIDAVTMVLEQLNGRMKFVTVPELLKHGQPNLRLHYEPPPQDLIARLKEHPVIQNKGKALLSKSSITHTYL